MTCKVPPTREKEWGEREGERGQNSFPKLVAAVKNSCRFTRNVLDDAQPGWRDASGPPHPRFRGFVQNRPKRFRCPQSGLRTWATATIRFQALSNDARILSSSSIDIAPGCFSPFMKNVGVESTLNFCEPRSRICWTLASSALSLTHDSKLCCVKPACLAMASSGGIGSRTAHFCCCAKRVSISG